MCVGWWWGGKYSEHVAGCGLHKQQSSVILGRDLTMRCLSIISSIHVHTRLVFDLSFSCNIILFTLRWQQMVHHCKSGNINHSNSSPLNSALASFDLR